MAAFVTARASWLLAGMVCTSAVVRFLAAAKHHTPWFFQDEYAYAALARGLAETGRFTVRSVEATFPALLQPLLTAPAWLVEDPAVALRLTQGVHALSMSLAAVPVYLLGRHLRLGPGVSLAVAGFVLLHPGLAYASFLLAEPVAMPLALAAFYVGVRALEFGSPRAQLLFLALAGLTTSARIQYAFLPFAFLAAALIVERGSLRRVVTRFRLMLGLLALAVAVLAVLDPRRLAGTYWHFPADWYEPGPLLQWAANNLFLLAYSAGWVLVPGALVAVGTAVLGSTDARARAFAALLLTTAAALLLEASVMVNVSTGRFEERYLMVLPPLVAVAFGLWWALGARRRWVVVGVALGLLILSMRLPLSAYSAAFGGDASPTLWALVRLEGAVGIAEASLVFAGAAGALSLLAVLGALRPRAGGPLALASALVAAAGLSVGAHLHDGVTADTVRAKLLGPDLRWVDRHDLGGVMLVHAPNAHQVGALLHLFWNHSLDRVALLDGASQFDIFSTLAADVADDGRLLVGGAPVARPLLVNQAFQAVVLEARRLESAAGFDLWLPDGAARMSSVVSGGYLDGWLSGDGRVTVWPDRSGRVRGVLTLELDLPRGATPNSLVLEGPGVTRSVSLEPGNSTRVDIPVDSDARWELRFTAGKLVLDRQLRSLSVRGAVSFRRTESELPTSAHARMPRSGDISWLSEVDSRDTTSTAASGL